MDITLIASFFIKPGFHFFFDTLKFEHFNWYSSKKICLKIVFFRKKYIPANPAIHIKERKRPQTITRLNRVFIKKKRVLRVGLLSRSCKADLSVVCVCLLPYNLASFKYDCIYSRLYKLLNLYVIHCAHTLWCIYSVVHLHFFCSKYFPNLSPIQNLKTFFLKMWSISIWIIFKWTPSKVQI